MEIKKYGDLLAEAASGQTAPCSCDWTRPPAVRKSRVLKTSHKPQPSAGRAIRGGTLNKQFILSYDLYIVLEK